MQYGKKEDIIKFRKETYHYKRKAYAMKKFTAFIMALCLSFAILPFGAAVAAENRSGDRDFEKIIDEISEKWEIPKDDLIAGYLNLATGEEHYWQGDKWEFCGSMYKVPLNMYVTEKIVNGTFDWEKKYPEIPYQYAMKETLLNSSNEWAKFLWESCGSYTDYKMGVMPYMGIKQSDLHGVYEVDNKFTARQFIRCLQTLYENPDRFPSILDTMMDAEPERFFRYAEKRYPIAQKYGYVVENYSYYTNACGIVFTDEPIAIVMFTRNALYPDETLSAYCTAMCDYTQSRIEKAPEKE